MEEDAASGGTRRLGGVEVQERRRPTFLKKNVGAVKDRKPYGSRKPKNVRGGSKP